MAASNRLNEYWDLLSSAAEPDQTQQPVTPPLLPDDGETRRAEPGSPIHNYGLSTREALQRLHDDLHQEIVKMRAEFSKRKLSTWFMESISFRSELSKMRWPSVLFMTAQALAHFVIVSVLYVESNLAMAWVGFQGVLLSLLLLLNILVNLWDTQLRYKELLIKSERVVELIQRCSNDRKLIRRWERYSWRASNSKALFIPRSPCVNQTLTYRDNSCLNLPDQLLVRGDIIHLLPGDRAPGECMCLDQTGNSALNADQSERTIGQDNKMKILLREGQIFHSIDSAPDNGGINESDLDRDDTSSHQTKTDRASMSRFAHARLEKMNKGKDFLLLSTPFVKSLRLTLQRSHKRPVNSVEKECFIVSRKYFETFVIPAVFALSTIVTAIHYGYLDLTDDEDQKIKTISIAYLLLRPSLTIMPFLPWMFPCFWLVVNAYGSARLLCCGESQRKKRQGKLSHRAGHNSSPSPSCGRKQRGQLQKGVAGPKVVDLLATPTVAGSSENKHDGDDINEIRTNIEFRDLFKVFIDLLLGRGGHVWRSSSLLQVLGCLTSLCCIDKVGIISWPNPTPDKVFILTKSDPEPTTNQHLTVVPDRPAPAGGYKHGSEITTSDQDSSINRSNASRPATHHVHRATKPPESEVRAEVLDVSHPLECYRESSMFNQADLISSHHQNQLQFDDLNWQKYSKNLKPLGLAILMNNCCEKSFGDYFRFYKHISLRSVICCNQTPVVKRRCICSISKLVGFNQSVLTNYEYINQIGVYKLIDSLSIRKGKLVSSFENSARLKLPFSNMTCNFHQDTATGNLQIFSQGTADIILDACVEFWDGKGLVALDDTTRKRIMDFYHRNSLTSYCTAFSYSPALKAVKLGNHYIELPAESSKSATRLRRLAKEIRDEHLRNQLIRVESRHSGKTRTMKFQRSREESSNHYSTQDEHDDVSRDSPPATLADDIFLDGTWTGRQMTRQHLSAENLSPAGEDAFEAAPPSPPNEESEITVTKPPSSRSRRPKHRTRHGKLEEALNEITDQVFVGMVAMQYQACPDFVALVEQLEHACIRFIHFSNENELRSRVFSEKMGLESGWNCHISLQSDQDLDRYPDDKRQNTTPSPSLGGCTESSIPDLGSRKNDAPSTRVSNILMGNGGVDVSASTAMNGRIETLSLESNEQTLYSWTSLPSLVMKLSTKLSRRSKLAGTHTPSHGRWTNNDLGQASSVPGTPPSEPGEEGSLDGCLLNEGQESEQSARDERLETLAFDMSNRAKLPKGIENIRPHLETVDNIPLQVSLFTDCTPELTKQMIEVMQDYGEIVCVIGSASSRSNTTVFLQANASIAIEPLVPASCTGFARQSISNQKKLTRRDRYKAVGVRKGGYRNGRRRRKAKTMRSSDRPSATEHQVENAPRRNNPRDRLGIGSTAGPQRRRRESSSSSSSTSTSQVSSFSSASCSKLDSQSVTPSTFSSSHSCSSSSTSETSSDGRSSSSSSSAEAPKFAIEDVTLVHEMPEPSALATCLASLPCSYNYSRKDPVNLYSLIMEARHFTFKMRNTFVCMICFALSISSAQFLASILFLPPIFSPGLTIWMTLFVVPMMSFTLMNTTMDSQVMKIAVGKNLQLKPENITFFVVCYLIKFIPSIIVVVLNFGLIIAHSCKLTGFGMTSLGPCWMFTYVQHGGVTGGHALVNSTNAPTANEALSNRPSQLITPGNGTIIPSPTQDDDAQEELLWSTHLLMAQVCAAFLMVLYFVVISSGFVHRTHLFWQRSPTRNHLWVCISLVLIFGQLVYNQLVLQVTLGPSVSAAHNFLKSLPAHIWLIAFTWPVLVTGINLLVKRAEIKAIIRQQRHARFDFNTKLGMNSPF